LYDYEYNAKVMGNNSNIMGYIILIKQVDNYLSSKAGHAIITTTIKLNVCHFIIFFLFY